MVYFYTNPSFYYMGMFFFFACSISIQMMLGYYVLKIEKEAEKIEEGKADLLLPCIREYIKEGDRIKNSSLFIEKSLREIKVRKLSFVWWKHLSGQSLLFGIFMAGIGACVQIIMGSTLGEILPYYIISFLGLYCYFSISGWVDYEERKKVIKANLSYFFETKSYQGIYEKIKKEEIETPEESISFREEGREQLQELLREILA